MRKAISIYNVFFIVLAGCIGSDIIDDRVDELVVIGTRITGIKVGEKVKYDAMEQAEKLETEAATTLEEADAYAASVKLEAEEQAEEAESRAASGKEAADAYAEAVISQAKNHAERVEKQAAVVLQEADAYSPAVKTEAQQQAEEIVELARAAAEQEADGIRQRSQDEASKALTEVEMVRAAVQQELEAQQIYTESARVTVESLEVLGQIRAKLTEYSLYPGSDPISESAEDDPLIVEQPRDAHQGDFRSNNLSEDQLKSWLD